MLAQLESKILDLQSQIQATQAQITDYQTNPIYIKQAWGCGRCGDLVFDSISLFCENLMCPADSTFYYAPFFTKVSELAQAQAQLATLQNELKATQVQYEQAKEQYILRAMILNQSFVTTPPPSKNLPSQKVLKEIESLQGYLKQKPLYTTAQARLAVECWGEA